MANSKPKTCECGEVFLQYNSFQKYCSATCKFKYGKKINIKLKYLNPENKKRYVIPKVSEKRKIDNLKYYAQRIVFLGKPENKICPITGWEATEVHHKWCGKDRAKYYLDKSTWMAVSRDGHNWIHDNPKEAREKGFLK